MDGELTIYAEPDLSSKVLATLKSGDELYQGEFIRLEEIDGRYWRWYAVNFGAPDFKRNGYIWTPENFDNNQLRYQDTLFSFNVKYNEKLKRGEVTLYAQRNGETVSQTFETVSTGFGSITAQKSRLSDVVFMLQFYISNEACGYPDEKYYFAWTGTKLVPLTYTINFTDEWAQRYYSEYIMWPDDDITWNTFIKMVEVTEYTEAEDGERHEGRSSCATVVYKWNGREALPMTQNTELLEWWHPDKYNW